jgi:hypothetical protein
MCSPVKYELSFYISEGDILHSHRRENLTQTTQVVPQYVILVLSIRIIIYESLARSMPRKGGGEGVVAPGGKRGRPQRVKLLLPSSAA